MEKYYTNEKNTLMLISLLKAHNIKKVIASPGTTNISFIASIQNDPYFEVYSCVDERSACYIACGLAEESGEPVVLSCTGATASRNYMPGLTEAYYRKLPILAVTSTQSCSRIGHHIAQVIDRSNQPNDITKLSVQVPTVRTDDDEWSCNISLNKAILELKHRGNGPVHINLETNYSTDFSIKNLPDYRVINRFEFCDELPKIENKSRVAIFIGAHSKFSDKQIKNIEKFCENYNAIVLCDHTSNYYGKYKILPNIVLDQEQYLSELRNMDLLIHIGNVSGAYIGVNALEVWRVNPDGEIRDTFKKLKYVFELTEEIFFERYNLLANKKKNLEYYNHWQTELNDFQSLSQNCNLPFSNLWVAQNTIKKLPKNSIIHLAILNTLRSWDYFEHESNLFGYSNTGGFGIDGIVSTILGSSLASNKNVYGIVGDLAFFYDMNVIGNRNFKNNIRLIIINNGCGTEFHNYNHPGALFGNDANKFIAANDHFGKKSINLVKHYAEDLGFEYRTASNKEEFLENVDYYTEEKEHEKSLIFEIFTDSKDESDALKVIRNLKVNSNGKMKRIVKNVLGEEGVKKIKKIIKK